MSFSALKDLSVNFRHHPGPSIEQRIRCLFPAPFLDLPRNLPDHLFMFQDNGNENGFQRIRMSLVDPGDGMKFCAVEKPVKGLLILLG
jgi:hypothetical protein